MRSFHLTFPIVVLALVLSAAGCTSSLRTPQLGGLYNALASRSDVDRNPVIVIPGIIGSRLIDQHTKRTVWGAFSGNFANPSRPDGARLLALPMRLRAPLHELRDDVVSDGVLDRVRLKLLGVPIELRAYAQILAILGVGGYRDEQLAEAGAVDYGNSHFTCFQFDYDWRRDNVENAARLDHFIHEKREYVQRELKRRYGVEREIKFDIVAHSMGGLIARYFLMYGDADVLNGAPPAAPPWTGARHVERVVLVGTPNGGSIDSLLNLVQGAEIGPTLPRIESAIVGTMPAVYQLLPPAGTEALVNAANGQPLDYFDPQLWGKLGWGLASPAQEKMLSILLPDEADPNRRQQVALDHQRKCLERAQQFHNALAVRSPLPPGLELYLVAGDAEQTPAVAEVNMSTGALRIARFGAGDGTVLRASALLSDPHARSAGRHANPLIDWSGVHFIFRDHLGLTKDPVFADNVLYLLLERQRRPLASTVTH